MAVRVGRVDRWADRVDIVELATGGGDGSCDRSRLLCLCPRGRDELALSIMVKIGMVLAFELLEFGLLLDPAASF